MTSSRWGGRQVEGGQVKNGQTSDMSRWLQEGGRGSTEIGCLQL